MRTGVNVCPGWVTHRAVAEDLGYEYTDPVDLLQASRAPRAIDAAYAEGRP